MSLFHTLKIGSQELVATPSGSAGEYGKRPTYRVCRTVKRRPVVRRSEQDSDTHFQGVQSTFMKPAFLRFVICAISVLSITAVAQSSSPSAGLPAAPSAAGSSAADPAGPVATNPTGTKVGTINIQEAIFASNEG